MKFPETEFGKKRMISCMPVGRTGLDLQGLGTAQNLPAHTVFEKKFSFQIAMWADLEGLLEHNPTLKP